MSKPPRIVKKGMQPFGRPSQQTHMENRCLLWSCLLTAPALEGPLNCVFAIKTVNNIPSPVINKTRSCADEENDIKRKDSFLQLPHHQYLEDNITTGQEAVKSKNTSAAITALFSVGISDTARVSSQAISVIWSGRMKASNNTCKGKLFLKRFLWVCFYFVNKFICTTSFQILHKREVRWYFSFSASHTSLSMTTSRPIRVPSIGIVPFFLMAE